MMTHSRASSFVRSFRALSARHTPTSPEKACVGGAHTDTEAAYTRGAGVLRLAGSLSLPAQMLARCSRGPALPPALACIPVCVRRTHYVVPLLPTLLSRSHAPCSG